MPRNSRDGVRVTAADVVLARDAVPARLHLRTDSEAASLVVEHGDVVGVRLVDGTVQPAAWVVLCAGVYGSPTVLLRSGVGPADHLADVGVDVVVDLPGVGANLADHPGFDLDTGYRGDPQTQPRLTSLATFRSSLARAEDPPDLALWLYDPFGGPDEPAETWIGTLLLTPRARGTVRLRSADPHDLPRITMPRVTADDVRRLVDGTTRAVEVGQHPAVRRICAEPLAAPRPADLAETVRRGAESYPHTVGTCAMGPELDAGAVVDRTGAVHGVGRLSVADASVLPTAPSGFPHLLSMVLAERIADHVVTALTASGASSASSGQG
jgi:choline dehydrogenase